MSLGVVNTSLYTNLVDGYTTTVTAAGTTTLSYPSSTRQQFFTGTTTQTLRLPVTTTFPANGLGICYEVINNSTGIVTVQTGGSVTITTVAASTTVLFRCINVSVDATTSWSFTFPAAGASGSLTGDVTGTLAATNVVAVDGLPINATTGANSSIFFGYSGSVPTATTSIGIGYQALNAATSSAVNNVAIGSQAMSLLTTGGMGISNNVAIGHQTMMNASALSQINVAIGCFAMSARLSQSQNVFIGGNSVVPRTSMQACTVIGNQSSLNVLPFYSTGTASQSGTTITGVGTTFTPDMIQNYIVFGGNLATTTRIIGYTSTTVLTAEVSQTVSSTTIEMFPEVRLNCAIGHQSLNTCRSWDNCALGSNAGPSSTASSYSDGTAGTGGVSSVNVTGVGTAWTSVLNGGYILFTGGVIGAISTVTSLTTLTLISAVTVANGTSYTIYLKLGANTLIGNQSGGNLTTGFGNTCLGYRSWVGQTAQYAICIGMEAKCGVASALNSIMVGLQSGNTTMTGASNIGIGSRVLVGVTTGNQNLAIGDTALTAVAAGGQNIGIGHLAGTAITSGSGNTVIGANAGSSITTLANNVCVGSGANSSVAGAVAIGQGITANQTGGFFCTHRGPISVTFNAAGFIAGTNELVELTSSRRFKTNIRDLEQVSEKFDRLRPVRFTPLEGHGDINTEHIGLIAEEVEELWPEFVAHDLDGQTTGMAYDRMISVLIKEMQSMKREFRTENDALRTEIAELKSIYKVQHPTYC